MIKKYRKKPIVIEALQWDGGNLVEITAFLKGVSVKSIESEINSSELAQKNWKELEKSSYHKGITIPTLKELQENFIHARRKSSKKLTNL